MITYIMEYSGNSIIKYLASQKGCYRLSVSQFDRDCKDKSLSVGDEGVSDGWRRKKAEKISTL
jgi:hypothetical protein